MLRAEEKTQSCVIRQGETYENVWFFLTSGREEGIMVVEPANQPTGREREANNDDAATKQTEEKREREGEEKKGSRGRYSTF